MGTSSGRASWSPMGPSATDPTVSSLSAGLTPALVGFQKGRMWVRCIPVPKNTCGKTVVLE